MTSSEQSFVVGGWGAPTLYSGNMIGSVDTWPDTDFNGSYHLDTVDPPPASILEPDIIN